MGVTKYINWLLKLRQYVGIDTRYDTDIPRGIKLYPWNVLLIRKLNLKSQYQICFQETANMSNFIANQFDIHRCVIRLDRNYMRLTTPLIVYWRQNMFSYRLAYAQKEFLFNWTYLLLCNACCFTTDPLLSVLFYLLFFVIFSYNIMVNSRCSNSIQVKRKKTSHSRNTMIAQ